MEQPREKLAPGDRLDEAPHLLRLKGCVHARSERTAPWGAKLPRLERYMIFHLVTTGHGLLAALRDQKPGRCSLRSGIRA